MDLKSLPKGSMHSETCAIFPLAKHTCTIPSGILSLVMPTSEAMATESMEPMEMAMTQTQDDFEELLERVSVHTVESFFLDLDFEYIDIELHDLYHESSSVAKVTSLHQFSSIIDSTLSPCTMLLVNKIQGKAFNRPRKILFDSGSDCSHIQK